jgi:lipopolysaccharide transport system permease protein
MQRAAMPSIVTKAPDRSISSTLRDLYRGLERWPLLWLLAVNDLKQRYRRSKLGQFWLTLSMGVTVGALGLLYPMIFHISAADYLPHVAVSYVVWTLLSSLFTDGCVAFISAAGFLKQSAEPRSIYVYRVLVRNALVLAHNALVIVVAFVLFRVGLSWSALLSLVGLALLFICSGWIVLLLGTFCARFRDLPQIITSLMQVAFLVTPVMWAPTMLPADRQWIVNFNPFGVFLAIVRDPLLGHMPSMKVWLIAFALAFGGYLLVIPFFARFRARIVYWL